MNTFFYESIFGTMKIVDDNYSILYFKKVDDFENIESLPMSKLAQKCILQFEEYIKKQRTQFDLPIKLCGTEFQIRVWKELSNIPYGQTRSYKDIAIAIGNEKASRAVGNSNNKNPITVVVPCHRVVGSNKKLVGYASGLEMKERLLEIENTVLKI